MGIERFMSDSFVASGATKHNIKYIRKMREFSHEFAKYGVICTFLGIDAELCRKERNFLRKADKFTLEHKVTSDWCKDFDHTLKTLGNILENVRYKVRNTTDEYTSYFQDRGFAYLDSIEFGENFDSPDIINGLKEEWEKWRESAEEVCGSIEGE